MERPWFGEGLRFECARCGNCCRGPEPGYVWVTDEEIAALAERLGLSVDGFGRRYLRRVGARLSLVERANHDCVFWEEGRGCTVYEQRPAQCRTFPFWPEITASAESWARYGWCRGKDQGRLYPVEEIERLERGEGSTGPQSPP
jgi:Fe-S-cluster containining protein